jgi:hypothetical protein
MNLPESKTFQRRKERIAEIFSTNPRNGADKKVIWQPRTVLEERLDTLLFLPGTHICVDGPWGSGKSSLILTSLRRSRRRFTMIQMTKNMSWSDFCKEVSTRRVFSGDIKLKLDKSLWPEITITKSASETTFSDHELGRALKRQKAVLLLDDFERASQDLVVRIADICKLLTQQFDSRYAKVIIAGTHDFAHRIYSAQESLEGRLAHLSVGTLPSPRDCWDFLFRGFNALGLTVMPSDLESAPGNEGSASHEDPLYGAIHGSPKFLNEVGKNVALKSLTRGSVDSVSATEIIKTAKSVLRRDPGDNYTKALNVIGSARSKPTVMAVLRYLCKGGIGQIYRRDDIVDAITGFQRSIVEDAIATLIEMHFFTCTGASREVLYVSRPSLACLVCTMLDDPGPADNLPFTYQG